MPVQAIQTQHRQETSCKKFHITNINFVPAYKQFLLVTFMLLKLFEP